MSYKYASLEQVLAQAAYHLPLKTLGRLISRAEEIITTRSDSTLLEREIFKLLHEHISARMPSGRTGAMAGFGIETIAA